MRKIRVTQLELHLNENGHGEGCQCAECEPITPEILKRQREQYFKEIEEENAQEKLDAERKIDFMEAQWFKEFGENAEIARKLLESHRAAGL